MNTLLIFNATMPNFHWNLSISNGKITSVVLKVVFSHCVSNDWNSRIKYNPRKNEKKKKVLILVQNTHTENTTKPKSVKSIDNLY